MKKKPAKKRTSKTASAPPPQPTLAEKISQKELSNALARLNAGKHLTTREAKLIDEFKAKQTAQAEDKSGKPKPEFPQDDTVQNAKAAADRIGCSLNEVKLARSMDCDAFGTANRISISRLSAFLQSPEFREAAAREPEQDEAKAWDARLKRAKALQAEHRLKVEEGKAWDAERARVLFGAGDAAMADTLRRMLESELPPLVEGKSAGQILKVTQKFCDSLIGELKSSRVRAMAQIAEDYDAEHPEE